MESKRQKQIGEIVRRNFGTMLQQEGAYIYGSAILVTVTKVKMSPDMGIAKIYFSVYNTENKQAVILELENHMHRLKQALAARIRKKVRRIPNISFYLDDTLDEMYRLSEFFDELETKKNMNSEEE